MTSYLVQGKVPLANVQVDPLVMNTPYGKFIRTNPSVILHALASSLELGVMVTITLKVPKHAYKLSPCQWVDCTSYIIYIATANDGTSAILHDDLVKRSMTKYVYWP